MVSTDYAPAPTPSATQSISQNQLHPLVPAQTVLPPGPHTSQYSYSNGLTSPRPGPFSALHGNSLPLPSSAQAPLPGLRDQQYGNPFDTTGQIAPLGMNPRVTATLWEDGGSLIFQVETKGVLVARREDNHMINGTKLLNVANMTRGRRDGILKSEKMRHIVKIGPMHLKGVWIPFERALEFANKEQITEQLYPLFVHNIGALLYHPTNQTRTNAVMAAVERRKQEQNQMSTQPGTFPGLDGVQSFVATKLGLDRSHTFPTPPTSASNTISDMDNGMGSRSMNPLSIDTGLSNARSSPTTPASTPPGTQAQFMQQYQYQQSSQPQNSWPGIYSTPPSQQNAYRQSGPEQKQPMPYYSPNKSYIKNEMELSSAKAPGSGGKPLASNLYNVMSTQRGISDVSTDNCVPSLPLDLKTSQAVMNDTPVSSKHRRDNDNDDNEGYPSWEREKVSETGDLKRHKTIYDRGELSTKRRISTTPGNTPPAIKKENSPPPSQPAAPADQPVQYKRFYQACIPCQRRTVKCDLGSVDSLGDPPCARCRWENKECSFSAMRKNRKTDGEIEQALDEYDFEDEGVWSREKMVQALPLQSVTHNSVRGPPENARSGGGYGGEVLPRPPLTPDGQDERFTEAFETRPLLDGMHGMDEIRAIILQSLSKHGPEKLEDGPKQKKSKLEREDSFYSQCLDGSPRYCAEFQIQWKLKQFMRGEFGNLGTTSLNSVIALTGTAQHAQATTVTEYLNSNWPDTGDLLLDLIQQAFHAEFANSGVVRHSSESQDPEVNFVCSSHSDIDSVIVHGSAQRVVTIAQQIAWLGSALQTSDTDHIGRSQAQILSRESHQDIIFDFQFITDSLPEGEKSCWHDLFVNPVIAYNFPIPSRGKEVGLEIPMRMMGSLGGATHAVEYEGGLVIKGFSSMFVPLRKSGDSIQWHFIRNEDESRLEYWQADKRCPGRALLDSVNEKLLKSTRTFLGWWGKTVTNLGTADVNYDNLDWSAAKEPDRSATFSGGTIGFQNFATGELNFAVGPKDSRLHISRIGPYQRVVKYASRTPVVLYDTCEKRGWLVPGSSVIAHIAQTRTLREKFSVDGKAVDVIPTDPIQNVYAAAEKMLLGNAQTKLEDGGSEGSNLYFRDLVFGVWSLLESIMDKDIKKESTADPAVRVTTRKSLRGWEFMDVVDEISPMRQKETYIKKSCGDWPDLVNDINAVVLFASGFEDIIGPAEGSRNGLCHSWMTVPKGKDYLAATVPILNSLYERAGSRLTKKHLTSTHLQWHRGPILFERCIDPRKFGCPCDRLQRIVHESSMSFGNVNSPGPLEEQGAVIFGQAKHSLKTSISTNGPTKMQGIYSQGENVPLVVKAKAPNSPSSLSSSYHGSPSPPSLWSGITFTTTVASDNEASKEFDEKARVPYAGFQPHLISLKRPREESEHPMEEPRETQRQRPGNYTNDHYEPPTPTGSLNETIIKVQPPEEPLSPTFYTLDNGKINPVHRLRRKPQLQYNENEVSIPAKYCLEGQEQLPVRSQIQQKSR